MTTLSDAKFAALRTQLFTGAMSDMTLAWLQANGATSSSIPDAWREMLIAQGADAGTYHRNDAWYQVLGDLGYTGSLPDRELAFWKDGGTFNMIFSALLQSSLIPINSHLHPSHGSHSHRL
jgi:hypothetical protein